VRAYIDAINNHEYQRAWQLGGKNTGETYSALMFGFAGTSHDTLKIIRTQGGTVTASLTAVQTDGINQNYFGTYTVVGTTITHFDIQPVG